MHKGRATELILQHSKLTLSTKCISHFTIFSNSKHYTKCNKIKIDINFHERRDWLSVGMVVSFVES
jgi:hypothetical protein